MPCLTVTENPRRLEAVTADPFISGLEGPDARDRLAASGDEPGRPRHTPVDVAEPTIR